MPTSSPYAQSSPTRRGGGATIKATGSSISGKATKSSKQAKDVADADKRELEEPIAAATVNTSSKTDGSCGSSIRQNSAARDKEIQNDLASLSRSKAGRNIKSAASGSAASDAASPAPESDSGGAQSLPPSSSPSDANALVVVPATTVEEDRSVPLGEGWRLRNGRGSLRRATSDKGDAGGFGALTDFF